MFLHPVNVRCLVREYGSLEQSPEKISATVVEISGYSMSEVRACLSRWRGQGASLTSSLFAGPSQYRFTGLQRPLVFVCVCVCLCVCVLEPVNLKT